MNPIRWFFNRSKTVIISANKATVLVLVAEEKPKPAKSILMSIPVHRSLILNHKQAIMKTTGKIPFILNWLDANGVPTQDAVTNVAGSVGDGSSAAVAFDAGTFKSGFILGKANGSGDLVFTGLNSLGQPIQSVPTTLTVDDGGGGGTTPNVATGIGVQLGEEVPQ